MIFTKIFDSIYAHCIQEYGKAEHFQSSFRRIPAKRKAASCETAFP